MSTSLDIADVAAAQYFWPGFRDLDAVYAMTELTILMIYKKQLFKLPFIIALCW